MRNLTDAADEACQMDKLLREYKPMNPIHLRLLEITTKHIPKDDPSHDLAHIKRVVTMAIHIAEKEHADRDIVTAAAFFHDLVTYQKNDPRSKFATEESAKLAEEILANEPLFPSEKIPSVITCILECSWSKGLQASSLESHVLQDADRLEASGAISLMRTFSSGGQMNIPLYSKEDPFCEQKVPEGITASLNLLYQRLLVVPERLHTQTAKDMVVRRHEFLKQFEQELKLELIESGEYKNTTS